ncbi:MAG: hypothetical protein IPP74_03270 [Alphaproteobacteria bacterium]|nr:hypothetical protein [Alphaproteobacteria bacterium]
MTDKQDNDQFMQENGISDGLFPTEDAKTGAVHSPQVTGGRGSYDGFCRLVSTVYADTKKFIEKGSLRHYKAASLARVRGRDSWVAAATTRADMMIKLVSRAKMLDKLFQDTKHISDLPEINQYFGVSFYEMLSSKEEILAETMTKALCGENTPLILTTRIKDKIRNLLITRAFLRKMASGNQGLDDGLINDFKRALADLPAEERNEKLQRLTAAYGDAMAIRIVMQEVVSKQKSLSLVEQFQQKVLNHVKPEKKAKIDELFRRVPKKNKESLMREMMSLRDNMVDEKMIELKKMREGDKDE